MKKITIKKIDGSYIFSYKVENNSIKKTVEKAIKENIDLSFSDLRGADLMKTDFKGANFEGVVPKRFRY